MNHSALMKLIRALREVKNDPELGPDVTVRQLLCLLSVASSPNTSTTALMTNLDLTQSSTSRAIERLGVKDPDGFITAKLDPLNHKFRNLSLSERGNAIVEKLLRHI